ncbi:hypothetical protein SADUNF_Sadunf16G0115700 [Salix dunnii]|uniref:Uncharacterized protein n=1 Tax=Salix dunnii TaxID=1413687 RepID=A0A835J9D4_9ROSI|nr:hypothetical protein SADUNF_Sadunf16G0115700 [Salix dunnii]
MGKKFPSWVLMPILDNLVKLELEKDTTIPAVLFQALLRISLVKEVEEMGKNGGLVEWTVPLGEASEGGGGDAVVRFARGDPDAHSVTFSNQ